jgi:hypothetical protein
MRSLLNDNTLDIQPTLDLTRPDVDNLGSTGHILQTPTKRGKDALTHGRTTYMADGENLDEVTANLDWSDFSDYVPSPQKPKPRANVDKACTTKCDLY